ncbi:MAG: MTAP family purine nucleoside phosphorylase [Solirubrobacterales bacterium]
MGRLAVIIGSNALTPGGEEIAAVAAAKDAVILQRHGSDSYRLPHLIDHAANLRSLIEADCDRALAISSVGSLKPGLGVGSLVCPDDFIALQLGLSIFSDARGHTTPGFNPAWRSKVLAAWARSSAPPLHDGGVYWQTIGPRFETPAEIRLISTHADVVGMTLASECIVAGELELPYAAVCVVDNLANGIGSEPLSIEEVEADRARNAERVRDALDAVLPELVG